ncbi:MAG: BolA family protein [Legionellaceae bacterium]|nr:BolA family protein [Legionellaceae bacterium]
MLRAQRLHDALSQALKPNLLQIENESNQHQVPAGSESHFKVIIVSTEFDSLSRIARHRLVNALLASEFKTGLHALTLSLHTPLEWSKQDHVPSSPPCQRARNTKD